MWHGFENRSAGPMEFLPCYSFQRDTRTRHIVTEPLLLGYCVRLQNTKKREIVSLCSRGLNGCPPSLFSNSRFSLVPSPLYPQSFRWIFTWCSGKLFAQCPLVFCNALLVFLSLERSSHLWLVLKPPLLGCSWHWPRGKCWAMERVPNQVWDGLPSAWTHHWLELWSPISALFLSRLHFLILQMEIIPGAPPILLSSGGIIAMCVGIHVLTITKSCSLLLALLFTPGEDCIELTSYVLT